MSKFNVGDRVEGPHGEGTVTSTEGGWTRVTYDNLVERNNSPEAFRGSDVQVSDLYYHPELLQIDSQLKKK